VAAKALPTDLIAWLCLKYGIALRGAVVAAKALPTDLIAWLCLKYGVALRGAVVAAKALSTDGIYFGAKAAAIQDGHKQSNHHRKSIC